MGTIGTLNERLKQRISEDKAALDNLTREALSEHAKTLKKLSNAALNTTKSDMAAHQKALTSLHQQTLNQLRWLMLWPLMTSLALSLLIVISAAGWSWWQLGQMDSQLQAKQQQLQQLTADFCNSPAGLKTCKKG